MGKRFIAVAAFLVLAVLFYNFDFSSSKKWKRSHQEPWLGSATPSLSDAGNAHGTAVAGLLAERGVGWVAEDVGLRL